MNDKCNLKHRLITKLLSNERSLISCIDLRIVKRFNILYLTNSRETLTHVILRLLPSLVV